MPRYIDADDLKAVIHANDWSNPVVPDVVGVIIDRSPTDDVVPRAEAYEWYHEYHVLKEELKTEKMYHRETEKLADKYFVGKDETNGIRIRYNEKTGEWDKYEPYMTIECPEEKDYEFLQTAIAKQVFKEPLKESLADYGCPTCGAYINFDGLNGNIEHAPKYCSECGQRLQWKEKSI
jgi:predicted RNA-binding Zn-ribbon protein involved in translation (DUF1610 family)